MEKIKDIVYQISDILFGLVVLLAVLLIFTFQLYGWFNIDMPQSIARFIPQKVSLNTYAEAEPAAVKPVDSPKKTDTSLSDENEQKENMTSAPLEEPSPTQADAVEKPAPSELRNIVIASGSTSNSIGNALYENNIIKSVEEFTNRLTELKLETKIKAGTFRIPQNAPLDDVIKIITS